MAFFDALSPNLWSKPAVTNIGHSGYYIRIDSSVSRVLNSLITSTHSAIYSGRRGEPSSLVEKYKIPLATAYRWGAMAMVKAHLPTHNYEQTVDSFLRHVAPQFGVDKPLTCRELVPKIEALGSLHGARFSFGTMKGDRFTAKAVGFYTGLMDEPLHLATGNEAILAKSGKTPDEFRRFVYGCQRLLALRCKIANRMTPKWADPLIVDRALSEVQTPTALGISFLPNNPGMSKAERLLHWEARLPSGWRLVAYLPAEDKDTVIRRFPEEFV